MKPLVACLLFMSCLCTYGQSLSEMLSQLDTTEDDSTKISLYGKIAMQYRRNNPDSAFLFSWNGTKYALQKDHKNGIASMYNVTGVLHFYQSNYDSCLWYFTRCYDLSVELKDSLRLGAMLNNIGSIFTYTAKYDTCIQVLLMARELREKINDPKVSSTVNNLGNAYLKMKDYEPALKYYKEAAELKENFGQRLSLSNTLNNIGIILKGQGKYEQAIPWYERSLSIAIEFDDRNKQANAHNNLGTLYLNTEEYAKSELNFLKAIQLKEEMGDKAGLFNSYNTYAELLSATGRHTAALIHIEKAEELEKQIGTTMYTADGLLMKSFVLRDLGRYKDAYEVYRKAYVTKIDQINEDRNEKIAEWEARFENHKQEAEIQQLELANQLKDANLAKSRNAQLAIAIGAILTIVSFTIYFAMRSRKLRAENEAQELQLEAMRKRLIELNISVSEIALDLDHLNNQLHTELTEREFEVLSLSMDGKTNLEISDSLFISKSTVKFHLRNTYGKLGVNNRKEALKYISKTPA